MNTMTRKDRLRRVVLLCSSFGRNLAFYRVGQSEDGSRLLSPTAKNASFWGQANSNCLDQVVLEWCKLLGDKRGEHYWAQIVTDPADFEADLLRRIGMKAEAFEEWAAEMRRYRDKFVAHLDSDATMHIPMLDAAQASVWFYHEHLVTHEAQAGDLAGLPDTAEKFNSAYEQCVGEAKDVFLNAQ